MKNADQLIKDSLNLKSEFIRQYTCLDDKFGSYIDNIKDNIANAGHATPVIYKFFDEMKKKTKNKNEVEREEYISYILFWSTKWKKRLTKHEIQVISKAIKCESSRRNDILENIMSFRKIEKNYTDHDTPDSGY